MRLDSASSSQPGRRNTRRVRKSVWLIAGTKRIVFVSASCHKPYAICSSFSEGGMAVREAVPHDGHEGDATDLADQSRWTARSTTNAAQEGSQIHIASLARIRTPYALKNSLTLIGDTRTGRTGKKYLVVSNGEKNATPNPPFVIASSTPCEAVHRKK